MSLRQVIKHIFFWQVGIVVIVAFSVYWLPLRTTFIGGGEQASFANPQPYIRNPFLYFRGNFDGIHYINIANHGIGLYEEAFFPLYPKLVSFFKPYIANSVLTGSLISTTFLILALHNLHKLIAIDYSKEVSRWTILSILIFPTSFFFTSVYTESLFLFLSVAAFYAARRNRYYQAAFFVALATYTRFVGIFLIPALLIEYWQSHGKIKFSNLLPFLIMPLGLISYMSYLNNTKGDAFAFIHVQKNFGQGRSDKIILPYQVVYRYIRMLTSVNYSNPIYPTLVFESFIALSFITVGTILLFKSRTSYAFYSLVSLILPTLTGNFTSMPRYALLCFPIFIFIGKQLQASPASRYLYIVSCVLLSVIFVSMFARGYWVA